MFDKMKDLMEMKKQADRVKKELDVATVEVKAVDGITLVVNGAQKFQSIEIDDRHLQEGNAKQLESDMLKSLNEAVKRSQDLAAQKMKAIMPGFPGM